MSVNKSAHSYLLELKIGRVLVHCLDEPDAATLHSYSLSILQYITCDINETNQLDDLLETVTLDKIRRIAKAGEDKVATLARKILTNITQWE